jgi:hypothetical protein
VGKISSPVVRVFHSHQQASISKNNEAATSLSDINQAVEELKFIVDKLAEDLRVFALRRGEIVQQDVPIRQPSHDQLLSDVFEYVNILLDGRFNVSADRIDVASESMSR